VARVAVLGASGYTGAEVVRLSALHPNITIAALTGEKQAGKVRGRITAASLS
jgi:N-acetyl-gamma-glutamyl-phosphate reductase